jgi:MYXO-CTERM domain-containing protein
VATVRSLPAAAALALACLAPALARPAEPVLFFSDLAVAPKNGLGDGLGQGAIVTVWGVSLGASQGASTVTCGGAPAAHVYFWGNADGGKAAGPADLYTSHRMQAVSFSVSAAAADGQGSIAVTVGGVTSNALPITVSPTGRIFHVTTGGSDTAGDGSWAEPWRTLHLVGCGAGTACRRWDNSAFQPGTMPYVIYAGDGVAETSGLIVYDAVATAAAPIAVVAYPGASVVIGPGNGARTEGIKNYNAANHFWGFAKLAVRLGDAETGIGGFEGARLVANEITNVGGCANGESGAIDIPGFNANDPTMNVGGGLKSLGNYIHGWGCDTTSKLEHTFYMANRSGHAYQAFELGWNHLRDNKAHSGLHVYDEGTCGDFIGTVRIHDNVVVNQVGMGVDVNTGGSTSSCFSMPVEIFNNLFVNVGLEVPGCENGGGHTFLISIGGSDNKSHVKVYNNTAVGWGAGYPGMSNAGYGISVDFAGTWEWVNNIVVDAQGQPFVGGSGVSPAPASSSANLWWGTASQRPAVPSFDAAGRLADPLFAGAGDSRLQGTSPAVDKGSAAVAAVVARDLDGAPRPQGSGYDIGAYEYVRGCSGPQECTTPPPCHGSPGATCNGGTCSYPALANGLSCADDGDPCTGDVCQAGVCAHPAISCGDAGTSADSGVGADAARADAAGDASAPRPDAASGDVGSAPPDAAAGSGADGGSADPFASSCGCAASEGPALALLALAGLGAGRRRRR